MQKKYACVRYLHSRITVYHACKIDLRHSKALHSCVTCRLLHLGLPCSAIHYGVCQAVNVPAQPNPPSSKTHRPVSAQKSKPIPVPSAKPVPASLPKPVPVQKSKPESGVSVQSVSVQGPKPVPVQRPRPAPAVVPIPVVAVTKKSSPQSADAVNNNTWPLPAHKPVQPQPGNKATQSNLGYPNTGPSRTREQLPVHQSGPAQSARPGAGQAAKLVVHSVQPATSVVVRTSSENSVTLPGGGVLVRTGPESGMGTHAASIAASTGLETAAGLLGGGPAASAGEETQLQAAADALDLNANTVDGTRTPRDGTPVRNRAQDVTEQRPSGDGKHVVVRTPVRVAASRPVSVPMCGPRPFPFSRGEEEEEEEEKEEEEEDFPAFPVCPEDRAQVTVPGVGQTCSQIQGGEPPPSDLRPVDNDLISLHHASTSTTTTTTTSSTPATTTTATTTSITTTTLAISTPTPATTTTTITTTTASLTSPISPPFPSLSPAPPAFISPPSPSASSESKDPLSQRGPTSPPDAIPPADSSASSSTSPSTSSTSAAGAAVTTTTMMTTTTTIGMSGRVENIPPFHFPRGKPGGSVEEEVAGVMQKVTPLFAQLDGERASLEQMGSIGKACGFPQYWKSLLYRGAGGDPQGYVTLHSFSAMLHKLYSSCHDEASRFVGLAAKPGCMSLEFDDLVPLIQDIVDGHPGLAFLQDAPEFHSRYIHTVVSRIFFCVNRSWTGRITVPELRRSNFLRVLSLLEDEEDINQITDYFSYEHFYVIYCKFWELDKDHDLFIDRADLARHNDHALNSRLIDRIFSGAVTRGQDFQEGRMPYKEFVWFLIAEEDKKHPTSIEYWFRCMDLDGDGVISMYEMEYFYEEQMLKMEALGIEKLPFHDCLCQMFDLVRPRIEEKITLSDLKNCRMADIFFDTFFNLDKFLEHEQRDPFAATREVDGSGREISDWDRYAAEEYDILVAEEGLNEPEEIHFDEDLDIDDDDSLEEHVQRLADSTQRNNTPRLHPATNDDIYDFAANDLAF